MNDDQPDDLETADPEGDDATGPDLDALDDAVLAADDTGMLAGERLITIAETDQSLNPGEEG